MRPAAALAHKDTSGEERPSPPCASSPEEPCREPPPLAPLPSMPRRSPSRRTRPCGPSLVTRPCQKGLLCPAKSIPATGAPPASASSFPDKTRWGRPRDLRRGLPSPQESLTHRTNTSNADSFSLISYIYRKIPEPEPDRFYRLSSLVAYPFSYPFFASRLLFPQEYTVVIENKNFSEKSEFFSDVFLFVLRTELLLAMCPTWSEGVFFIYGHVLLSSVPDALPRIRAPPLVAPYSGQTPEASPALLPRLCVMPTFE